MKKPVRRLRVDCDEVGAQTYWSSPKLTFTQHSFDEGNREAVIEITHPADIQAIREACDKVVAAWRATLDRLCP
jgi:hypothetical protein